MVTLSRDSHASRRKGRDGKHGELRSEGIDDIDILEKTASSVTSYGAVVESFITTPHPELG